MTTWANLTPVEKGFAIGAIPTFTMSLGSLVLSRVEVSSKIEAFFQNFAGGLILAAVAAELFPLMLDVENASDCYIGVTCGFGLGILVIYGIDYVVGLFEGEGDDEEESKNDDDSAKRTISTQASWNMKTMPEGLSEDLLAAATMSDAPKWEPGPLKRSVVLLTENVEHRNRVNKQIGEILAATNEIHQKATQLSQEPGPIPEMAEEISEKMDEEIHLLQYKIDYTKRLLQGVGSSSTTRESENRITTYNVMLSPERKSGMKVVADNMRALANHLVEHANEKTIDIGALREVYAHVNSMEKQLDLLHGHVEKTVSRWRTRRPVIPEMNEGDTLPIQLIVPVTIDCFVDGFMIGVTVALQPSAGIILGCANMLEMGFLGMAYSTQIKKCNGSSALARVCALYGPPFIMFLASGLGALVGEAAHDHPVVYIAFVAFGTLALLMLCVTELFIEAREAQGEEEIWWITLSIFLAVYIVIMTSKALS